MPRLHRANRVYEYLRITWGNLGKPGETYSKLVALRVEKKTNLALGLSRVAYCPECPGVSQSIQGHPRVTQGSLVTKVNFLMKKICAIMTDLPTDEKDEALKLMEEVGF